ncbi:MAG: YkyA family protein [Bacillota bacterium]|uniref:YkyA family protein n=1 Tax=Virgibacillus salarius TaxID=447199 RepID=A0A941IBI5_9BACI|nr:MULTISPECIES: YkyA family protein [Virgibacillus]NAZ09180.1 hypothetical protein [Agaribacter marinus]MBR7796471.1 YkyA family protein [Virgibacillus salarius]MCC2251151.1 YkyA family protein [Virgibacillus sp. AGTR]MDY7045313.1 YkyA family protein [Virgibacillus sp. M23]QRZ16817.1 YkyA family protein [Virgibacillus sp. AGTR]
MPLKKSAIFAGIILLLVISACSSKSTEEKIQGHLEEAVSLEQGFEEQQSKITDLEKEEQQLYSKIVNLGMDEMDKIKKYSKQAIETIDQRAKEIAKEKESIEAASNEFSEIEELITDLEADKVKKKAENMNEVMEKRYETYSKLNKAYQESLKLEKEMYTMLQKEDLEQKTLTEQINKINDSYEKVIDLNKAFNDNTVKYNNLKKEFYSLAGMEVSYEENPTGDKSNKETNSKESSTEK